MYFLGECSELISFWATLAQFWPCSDKKWLKISVKMLVPTIISKNIYTIQLKHVVYTC